MKLPSSSSLLLATLAVTASSSSLSALAAPAGDAGDSSSPNPAAPCPSSDGGISRPVGTSILSAAAHPPLFLTQATTEQQPQGRAFMPSFAAYVGAGRVVARDSDSGPDAANGNPNDPGSPAATTSAPPPTPTPESRDLPVDPPVKPPVSPPSNVKPPVEPPVKPPAQAPAKPAN